MPTLIGAWAAREQAQRERKLVDTWSRVYGCLNETLSSILTVKGFVREPLEVQRFLTGSQEGNTIVIAHRLSTVVAADRIVFMQDGAIVAVGRHRNV